MGADHEIWVFTKVTQCQTTSVTRSTKITKGLQSYLKPSATWVTSTLSACTRANQTHGTSCARCKDLAQIPRNWTTGPRSSSLASFECGKYSSRCSACHLASCVFSCFYIFLHRGRQRVLIKQKRPFNQPSCDFPQLVLNLYYPIFKFVVRILERTFSISCSEPENFSQLATGKQVSNELRCGCLKPPCVGVWNTPTCIHPKLFKYRVLLTW